MSVAVRPEHGPTLSELVPARLRRPAQAAAALAVLLLAVLVLRPENDGVDVVRTTPVPFNFRHPPELRAVAVREGELVRRERSTPAGKFVQSFAVLPFELPAYEGGVDGQLPVLASAEIAALRERYPSFELVEEGKARVNLAPAYGVLFRARLGERRLYGRLVLLPEWIDGEPAHPRRGVRLLLESTPLAGVGKAEDVGIRGLNKRPFRTFRFGTEKS